MALLLRVVLFIEKSNTIIMLVDFVSRQQNVSVLIGPDYP